MKLGSLNINIPQSHYDRFDEKSRSRKNKVHVFHGYRDDSVSFQPTPARLRPEPQAEPPTEDATLKELEDRHRKEAQNSKYYAELIVNSSFRV